MEFDTGMDDIRRYAEQAKAHFNAKRALMVARAEAIDADKRLTASQGRKYGVDLSPEALRELS